MALSPGTWLNHYEILGHLGTGGMGGVYRALDNKLQHEEALKVLPKAFAQDPERMTRFDSRRNCWLRSTTRTSIRLMVSRKRPTRTGPILNVKIELRCLSSSAVLLVQPSQPYKEAATATMPERSRGAKP